MRRAPYRLVTKIDPDAIAHSYTMSRWKWTLFDLAGNQVATGSTETRLGARWQAKRTCRAFKQAGEVWI